jgi:dTDP-4-amino-4,6-dideoxygalactose transaminase
VLSPQVSRDGVRERLHQKRIQTSVHYPPIHGFTAYVEAARRRPLPVTDDVAARLITLPLYPHMRDDQIDLVVDELIQAVAAE